MIFFKGVDLEVVVLSGDAGVQLGWSRGSFVCVVLEDCYLCGSSSPINANVCC